MKTLPLLILTILSCTPRTPIFYPQGQVIMVQGNYAAVSFDQVNGKNKAYNWFKLDSAKVGDVFELKLEK